MPHEGRKLSHHDRQEWARYHKEQVSRGNYIRRGNMKLVKDSAGGYYKASGDSCCGCGYNQQMPMGKGNKNRADKPPKLVKSASSPGGGCALLLLAGLASLVAAAAALRDLLPI